MKDPLYKIARRLDSKSLRKLIFPYRYLLCVVERLEVEPNYNTAKKDINSYNALLCFTKLS